MGRKYTVVGIYGDNGQVYVEHFEASTPGEAREMAENAMANHVGDPKVIAVFAGHHDDLSGVEGP